MRRSLPWNVRHPMIAAASAAVATAAVLAVLFHMAMVAAFVGVVVFACMAAFNVSCRDVRI
jgi:hypothetical protein